MIPLKNASIFSTSFQAILYGFSVLMFILTMWILIGNRHNRRVNYFMLCASCALLVLSSAEMAVNIARLYQGFITIGPSLPGGPDQYFNDYSHPTFITKRTLYNAQTLILDGVVIYRAYVAWQTVLVVIIPTLAWCGLLAASVGANFARFSPWKPLSELVSVDTGPWITATYALDLGTNVFATALLAGKIWVTSRRISPYRSSNGLLPIMRVVIESGALYSFTVSAGLALFILQSNGVYVVFDMTSPIISIVFNMIVVRMGLANQRRAECDEAHTAEHSSSFVAVARPPNGDLRVRSSTQQGSSVGDVELESVSVKITQLKADHTPESLDVNDASSAGHGEIKSSELGGVRDGTVHVISGNDLA